MTSSTISRQRVDQSRLSIVEHVYYEIIGEQPLAVETIQSHLINSNEQPFIRNIKIGSTWQEIDLGWIKDVGMIIIRNDGGIDIGRIGNTSDEVIDKTLLIGIESGKPLLYVSEGFTTRFTPYNKSTKLYMYSDYHTKISLYVFPG